MRAGKRRLSAVTFLFGLVIAVLAVAIVLFSQGRAPQLSVAGEQTDASAEQKPAESARVVLSASLAGSWYSADPEKLKEQFAGFFEKCNGKKRSDVIGLILPHAGYDYSGQTAAWGLSAIDRQYKRVIVIGPSHRTAIQEILAVARATHYETPLGEIPLDTEFIDRLLEYPVFQDLAYAFTGENSVEMELPLLRYTQKDFRLVPIAAGRCSMDTIRKAADILKGLVDQDTLIVASSDFVHYGSRFGYVPFTDSIPEGIKKLDMGAYEYIAKLDAEGFMNYKRRTGATICGAIPIAIVLSMVDKPCSAELLKYTTSGELTGDYSGSVSYLSAVFTGMWQSRPEVEPQRTSDKLSEEDKEQLLSLARKTILYALENKRAPQESDLEVVISDAVKQPRAAFVTLKKNHVLRGCIGDIFPQRPLYKSVMYNTLNAAFNDRRFPRLTIAECNDITIEISALTPPQPVESAEQIRIGTDGVVLKKDGHSAVYLPQVAPEQGWDLEQTLKNLSVKAQLPEDAWKQGARFLVFQADVFSEQE